MEQKPGSESIHIENAFNHANGIAVGPHARVNISDNSWARQALSEEQPAFRPTSQPVHQSIPVSMSTSKIIIISSRADYAWLCFLRTHLAFLEHQYSITFWDDSQIPPGASWRQTMASAIANARFALLLVSASFLASPVIIHHELPLLQQGFSQGQLTIWPLLLSRCLFEESPLGIYQPFNPDQPLLELQPTARDVICVRVAREILKVLQ